MGEEDLPDWAAELEGGGGGGSGAGRGSGSAGRRAPRRGDGDGGGGRRRGRGLGLGFVLGVAAGVAGALFLPDLVEPWLPAALRAERQTVEGVVLDEKREEDRLLLTVETDRGAVLATFTERVAEIELLVREGDTVALGLDRYRPFVTDPAVEGVRKARPPATEPGIREGGAPARPDTVGSGATEPPDTVGSGASETPDTGGGGGTG